MKNNTLKTLKQAKKISERFKKVKTFKELNSLLEMSTKLMAKIQTIS